MPKLPMATRLGLWGAALGVVAGVVQVTVGARIPAWTGAKASPVALGVLTIVLSVLAGGCAIGLSRTASTDPARRLALAIGLLVPAGLCFSTVGRLWFLPGPLLLGSAGLALAAGSGRDFIDVLRSHWSAGLVSALGAWELLMAASATPSTALVGAVGGLALMLAPWTTARSRSMAGALLIIGAVPFAVLTYWSVVPIVVGALAIAIGAPVVMHGSQQSRVPRLQRGDVMRGDTAARPSSVALASDSRRATAPGP